MSEYIYQSHGEPLVNERGEIYLARAGEIVRCRDCKFLVPQINDDPLCIRPYENVALWTNLNGFCKWGERKERIES